VGLASKRCCSRRVSETGGAIAVGSSSPSAREGGGRGRGAGVESSQARGSRPPSCAGPAGREGVRRAACCVRCAGQARRAARWAAGGRRREQAGATGGRRCWQGGCSQRACCSHGRAEGTSLAGQARFPQPPQPSLWSVRFSALGGPRHARQPTRKEARRKASPPAHAHCWLFPRSSRTPRLALSMLARRAATLADATAAAGRRVLVNIGAGPDRERQVQHQLQLQHQHKHQHQDHEPHASACPLRRLLNTAACPTSCEPQQGDLQAATCNIACTVHLFLLLHSDSAMLLAGTTAMPRALASPSSPLAAHLHTQHPR